MSDGNDVTNLEDEKNTLILESLKDLKVCMEDENYKEAIEKCESIIRASGYDTNTTNKTNKNKNKSKKTKKATTTTDENSSSVSMGLIRSIFEIQVQCYFQMNEYENGIEFIKNNKEKNSRKFKLYHAYALYRLERYEQAITILKSLPSSSTKDDDDNDLLSLSRHILAQSYFHSLDSNEAIDIYQKQLQQLAKQEGDGDEELEERKVEIWTNMLAAIHTNLTPYVGSSTTTADEEELIQQIESFLNGCENNETDYPYDLAYNLATWQMLIGGTSARETGGQEHNRSHWLQLLQEAKQKCMEGNEDEDENTSSNKDLAPILTNIEWSQSFWGLAEQKQQEKDLLQSSDLPKNVVAIRKVNKAIHSTKTNKNTKYPTDTNTVTNLGKGLPQRLYWYNKAVIELRNGKIEECRKSCDVLSKMVTSSSSSNTNKKNKEQQNSPDELSIPPMFLYQPTTCREELLWWESRIDVLKAQCLQKENKEGGGTAAAIQLLQDSCKKLTDYNNSKKGTSKSNSPFIDHAFTYVRLQQYVLQKQLQKQENVVIGEEEKQEEIVQILKEELPESIRSRKAVVATLAAVYHEQGKTDQVQQLLLSLNSSNSDENKSQSGEGVVNIESELAIADFKLSQGKYQEAVPVYEKIINQIEGSSKESDQENLLSVQARYVQALVHIDATKATELWSNIMKDNADVTDAWDNIDNNGEELEQRILPRMKPQGGGSSSSAAAQAAAEGADAAIMDSSGGIMKKNRKSHEAVLRRRARKRENYVKILEQKGLPVKSAEKMNPERWIPKYERSNYYTSNRRRNNTNRDGGGGRQYYSKGSSQGGTAISNKDISKLDVAARIKDQNAGVYNNDNAGPSTAHMTVSSSTTKRKGGGGRRR